jgi:methylmalonyl-CoA mutase cobalamin-binding domain/chain
MTKAIEAGLPQSRIEEAAARRQAALDSGREVIVGVNKYPPPAPTEVPALSIDNAQVLATQTARLARLKARRDAGTVAEALAALTRAEGNLLELAITAARARCTLGEISAALEAKFTRYQATPRALTGVYVKEAAEDREFAVARERVAEFARQEGRQPRILIAKLGQDGHDRGAKVIASAFADLGFDVDLGPLFQMPAEVARHAVENDVHIVGISSLAGAHKLLVPAVIAELARLGRPDIMTIVGGVIPPGDHPALLASGVAAIFGPGTVIPVAAGQILDHVCRPFPRLTAAQYRDGILGRDRAVLARALTLVESELAADEPLAREVLAAVLPHTGRSLRLGITGVPGAGKSTLIEALGGEIGRPLAVLSVDPSSPATGGSILGDKTRMERLGRSPDAFIRPSPARGHLGGVARRTRESILLCEAAGFEVIFVETVGVGSPRRRCVK